MALLGLLVSFLSFFSLWYYIESTRHIKIKKSVHILACGDSHVKCAINDSLIRSVQNICKSSQAYLYTYAVVKKIIENNPHIDTVIIGYSFHSLSDLFEDNLRRRMIKNDYPDYLPILDQPSLFYLVRQNPIGVIRLIPNVVNNSFVSGTLSDNSYPFIGKYYRSRKSNLDKFFQNKYFNKQFWKNNQLRSISEIQLIYLKQTLLYCKEKNVKVILLNTPVHPEYKKQIPDKFIKAYYNFYESNRDLATLIDLHEMKLPNEYYGDGHHVNKYGATLVTQVLDSILRGGNK